MKQAGLLLFGMMLSLFTMAQVDSTQVFVYGCTDPLALNYDQGATINDGSCLYQFGDSTFVYGCTDQLALNFNPQATIDDGSCEYQNGDSVFVFGCTDPQALNYNPQATIDDGSCVYQNGDSVFIYGCTDQWALNYDQSANIDDGSCIYEFGDSTDVFIYGCTNPLALNYNPFANVDDGSCQFQNGDTSWVYGCTDPLALNYNPLADLNDGSCEYNFTDCDADFVMYVDSINCSDITVINQSQGAGLSYTWTINQEVVATTAEFQISLPTGTSYQLCLTVASMDSCVTTACQFVDLTWCSNELGFVYVNGANGAPLSVEEQIETEALIYPNPATDRLNVELSGVVNATGYEVFSLDGKRLLSEGVQAANRFVVPIDQLTKGVYLIRVHHENGMLTQRFMKQ